MSVVRPITRHHDCLADGRPIRQQIGKRIIFPSDLQHHLYQTLAIVVERTDCFMLELRMPQLRCVPVLHLGKIVVFDFAVDHTSETILLGQRVLHSS